MLDVDLKEQLKSVFSVLEGDIELAYAPSMHADQSELVEMLEGVASTSPKISAKLSAPFDGKQSPTPEFWIQIGGKPTGIRMKGIPGGHEFSTLILGILNADQKGKLPDPLISARIKRLKGPIALRTYISLTCENCPDVVQALNQMALIHPQFTHEMIDGGYTPSEIEALGIQGVPSIVVGSKMIHSGKIGLLDLLEKLEREFGTQESTETGAIPNIDLNLGHFDTLVIGGGPAGASAAIYSARKGLKTAALYDKAGGQVQDTKGIENLISIPYTEGPILAAELAKHMAAYPIKTFEHRRVKAITPGPTKKIELESGESITADSIIIATGAKWRELGVPGEKEYLGRGVAYCPHCDGPFYKGKSVAVMGGGNSGVEAAIDLAGIVKDVVVFEYNDELKADKILVDKLLSLPNVSVIKNAKTVKINGGEKKVESIEYLDRKSEQTKIHAIDGIFIQIGLIPNSQFAKGLLELTPFGEIKVDLKGRTNVAGIYAAGDVTTTPYKQIIIAMGEGAKAALAAFEDKAFSPTVPSSSS